MRIVPGTDTVPNVVNKYLLPHEHQVITVRRHPAVLIKPIIVSLVGLAIAAVISTTVARNNSAAVGFVWIAWAVLLLWLVYKVVEWSMDYFIVTSRRMLLATGVFTRKVAMMPLVKVTDMSFQRSTLGRMLGYGEFILESAGQDQALRVVDHLPYPEQLYLEVCGLIFPGANDDDGDDDDKPPKEPPDAKCPVCHGERVVRVPEGRDIVPAICPNCHGTGIAPDAQCRVCKGMRIIPVIGRDRDDPTIAVCPRCAGTGVDPDWVPPAPRPDNRGDSPYDD